jgi:hypothetical protein
MAEDEDDLIAEFIRTKGVTKLPSAIAAPTLHHVPSDEERAFHASRGSDPMGDIWRAARPRQTVAQRRRTLLRKASADAFSLQKFPLDA